MGTANLPISSLTTQLGSAVSIANALAAKLSVPPFSASSGSASDLWPVKSQGAPTRISIPGEPTIEKDYHSLMTQGQFYEKSVGNAMHAIHTKTTDLQEKIAHYMSLNRMSTSAQLPHIPRVIALTKDSIQFLRKVATYAQEIEDLLTALQANLNMLNALSSRMLGMISQNLTAISNLMQQICNWHLPNKPSFAALQSLLFHWPGFQFTQGAGFKFNTDLSLGSNLNFSFSQCALLTQLESLLDQGSATNYIDAFGLVIGGASVATASIPLDGTVADTSQLTDPTYVVALQSNTTTPVVDPTTYQASSTSLPQASSIISAYQLPPEIYAANIVSATTPLQSAVIAAGEKVTPTAQAYLRQLLVSNITLSNILSSNYDPNVTAAWLFYVQLNRQARQGTWMATFEQAYTTYIEPSLSYLAMNPVPWNNVIDGTGVQDAPSAIPLLALLQGEDASTILWKLSYVEAALLGYVRNPTWDAANDGVYTGTFTADDLDYEATTITPSATSTVQLGVGSAKYPTACTFPQAMSTSLQAVISLATSHIATNTTYLSPRPQNRFIYNEFAEAQPVDRFSQFWRDFNANLITFLAGDAYTISRVVSYVAALSGAVDPLSDTTDLLTVQTDCTSRSRTWTPGVALLPIPNAFAASTATEPPTAATNGWISGSFDAAAFLQRPDIRALSIPTQIAMLRTSQSYDALRTLQTNLTATMTASVVQAQAVLSTSAISGWTVENTALIEVPATGIVLPFDTTTLDTDQFVTSPGIITVASAGVYALSTSVSWDSTGDSGTRTLSLLVNGSVVATTTSDSAAAEPFLTGISTLQSLSPGDTVTVVAAHDLQNGQTVTIGSSFMGIADPETQPSELVVTTAPSGATSFIAEAAAQILSVVSIQSGGSVSVIDTSDPAVVPSVDGVTLAAVAAGEPVAVGTVYGSIFQVSGSTFTVGQPLYANSAGVLTQDVSSLSAHWTVYVGKATATDSFLFQPHIPTT